MRFSDSLLFITGVTLRQQKLTAVSIGRGVIVDYSAVFVGLNGLGAFRFRYANITRHFFVVTTPENNYVTG